MKKLLTVIVSAAMIFSLASGVFAAPAEATWEDYQQYLIDTAGVNAPDLDEFIGQVEAIGSWEEMPLDQSPWDQFFSTLGLSTWEEFQAGDVKELAVTGSMGGGESAEGDSPAGEAPAEGESAEGESPADAAPAEGESSEDDSPAEEAPAEAADEAEYADETNDPSTSDMKVSSFSTNNGDSSRPQDEGHIYVGIAITDGEYDAENSNWDYDGGDIVFENAVKGEGFTALRVVGNAALNVSGALKLTDEGDGTYASDFTGTGAAVTAYDGATIIANGVNYYSEGFARSFLIMQNATAVINNSEIYTVGANPLTDAWDGYYNSANTSMMLSPPWVLGIQGGIRAVNVLGSGSTLIIADSLISAGGWACVSTDGCSNPYLYLYNTELRIDAYPEIGMNSGWKILGYDEYAYGTGYGTYLIGGAQEYFYGVTFNGQTYASILTGGDAYYKGLKAGETYDAVKENGTLVGSYPAKEDVPTVFNTVFGVMAHNSGSVNFLEGTVVNTEAATILYKSADSTWTIDGAEINPKSGIIMQMIDNDDSSVGGFNPFGTYLNEEAGFPTEGYTDAVSYVFTTDTAVDPAKTYYTSDTDDASGYAVVENPTDEGTVAYYERATGGNKATLNLANGEYAGDIYNATGYYAQAPDALTVNIADSAVLTGDIALSSHIHGIFIGDRNVDDIIAAIDEANANHANIGGYYAGLEDIEYVFIGADGEVTEDKNAAAAIQFTRFSTAEYYLLGQVLNRVNYNGLSSIDVNVEGTWKVAAVSLVTYLNVAEGAKVYGDITELADGSYLLVPSDEMIPAGEYGKAFVGAAAPAGAGGPGGPGGDPGAGGPGGDPGAGGPGGESGEGESPEGEAPAKAPAAESPAAGGDDVLEAYHQYLKDWIDAEKEINSQMEDSHLEEFYAAVDADNFSEMPGDMFFNGMLESGVAMTYDEFIASR